MIWATVRVRYVDGTEAVADAERWPDLRPDGVDYMDLTDDGTTSRIQGQSVVWLYREADGWVAGGGQVGHPGVIEVAVPGHRWRSPTHMPDLTHDAVKLGHWEPT